jgi:DNA helicase-2/ATP-dependent DNA helicase PcrA
LSASAAAARERLVAGLDPDQLRVVSAARGALCVLAGAGSGKTRVLTHRAAWMASVEGLAADRVLAVSFTNEAVEEMRGRLRALVGADAAAEMLLATFHAAAWRLCVRPYRALYPRPIAVIYSADDALSACRRALREAGAADGAREVLGRIALAKAQGMSPNELRRSGEGGARVAAIWRRYRALLRSAGALDFEDLLAAAVWLLERRSEVRRAVSGRFDAVLVDEYQDASPIQHRLVELVAPAGANLTVVGDDDQCLREGTLVTMADGMEKPIERVSVGDEVLSSYGTGTLRGARVTETKRFADRSEGIEILTASGRRIVSTPEHAQFAGFKFGQAPRCWLTYLMWKSGYGFRVGTARMYTRRASTGLGFQHRCRAEDADAIWVLDLHDGGGRARTEEAVLAARYGLPTIPFKARPGPGGRGEGSSESAALIAEIYRRVDSQSGGRWLLADHGLSFEHPHSARAASGERRAITVTMCADPRGRSTLHRLCVYGADERLRERLESGGVAVRAARIGHASWRVELARRSLGSVMAEAARIAAYSGWPVRVIGRMGPARAKGDPERRALPVIRAEHVRPGMTMFTASGWDQVTEVRRVALDAPVYDLNVENTHNFVASGLITHNSLYGFRGGDARALRGFEREFPGARRLTLARNYRSREAIVAAAARLIAHNPDRPAKQLRAVSEGGRVEFRRFADDAAEAEGVAAWLEARLEGGASAEELAVLARTSRYLARVEQLLVARGIRYRVLGRRRLTEHAEVRDVVALVGAARIGWHREALARAAARVPGLGMRTLERVFTQAEREGRNPGALLRSPESLERAVSGSRRAAAGELGERLRAVSEALSRGARAGVVCACWRSGWAGELAGASEPGAEARRERLRALCALADRFDREAGGEVEEFLAQLALAERRDGGAGGITLATIHAAKGREWHRVALVGAAEGQLPHRRALERGPEAIAAERCAAYVAMTRARHELCVSAPERLGAAAREAATSRFVAEAGLG